MNKTRYDQKFQNRKYQQQNCIQKLINLRQINTSINVNKKEQQVPQEKHDINLEFKRISCDNKLVKLYALSDIHTDYEQNLDMVSGIIQLAKNSQNCKRILILAGDISEDLTIFRQTLKVCKRAFQHIHYVPGNHDLWVRNKGQKGFINNGYAKTSIEKLKLQIKICHELGIITGPCLYENELLILPLYSWHHKSFDEEPNIPGSPSLTQLYSMDYKACKWPAYVSYGEKHGSQDVAQWFDTINDQYHDKVQEILKEYQNQLTLLTYSHFAPFQELIPEKRYLYFPNSVQMMGSKFLGKRIQQLKPDIHVFGHTHFGVDTVLNGTRFMQVALGYPSERTQRNPSLAINFEVKPFDRITRQFQRFKDMEYQQQLRAFFVQQYDFKTPEYLKREKYYQKKQLVQRQQQQEVNDQELRVQQDQALLRSERDQGGVEVGKYNQNQSQTGMESEAYKKSFDQFIVSVDGLRQLNHQVKYVQAIQDEQEKQNLNPKAIQVYEQVQPISSDKKGVITRSDISYNNGKLSNQSCNNSKLHSNFNTSEGVKIFDSGGEEQSNSNQDNNVLNVIKQIPRRFQQFSRIFRQLAIFQNILSNTTQALEKYASIDPTQQSRKNKRGIEKIIQAEVPKQTQKQQVNKVLQSIDDNQYNLELNLNKTQQERLEFPWIPSLIYIINSGNCSIYGKSCDVNSFTESQDSRDNYIGGINTNVNKIGNQNVSSTVNNSNVSGNEPNNELQQQIDSFINQIYQILIDSQILKQPQIDKSNKFLTQEVQCKSVNFDKSNFKLQCPQLKTAWSEFYKKNKREPSNVEQAPWIKRRRQKFKKA